MAHSKMSMVKANTAESSSRKQYPPASSAAGDTAANDAWLSLRSQTLAKRTSYACTICTKIFPTSQALGGHQNAHRKERHELRAEYIRRRLEITKRILATVDMMDYDDSPLPPNYNWPDLELERLEACAIQKPRHRNRVKSGGGGGGGHHRYRKPNSGAHETAAPSLELPLGIGGSGRRENYMAYSFPAVFLPACDAKGLDLTLKL